MLMPSERYTQGKFRYCTLIINFSVFIFNFSLFFSANLFLSINFDFIITDNTVDTFFFYSVSIFFVNFQFYYSVSRYYFVIDNNILITSFFVVFNSK